MRRRNECSVVAWCIAVTILCVDVCVAESPAESIAAAARAAKGAFKKVDNQALIEAKKELQAAAAQLEQRFVAAGATAADWQKYLLWGDLQGQIRQPGLPNVDQLQKVYARFAADHEGLGLVCFVRTRDALRGYLAAAQAAGDEKAQARYEAILDGLARRLESYVKAADPADAARISSALRWLDDTQQATEIVKRADRELRYPNLFLQASEWVVGAGIAESVDRVEPVRDCILGTDLYGTAHMVGQTNVTLVPNPNSAMFDTLLTGTVHSSNVGYHGPVTLWSEGCTSVSAVKRLWFSEDGIMGLPASSCAQTQSTITAICAKRAFMEKMAWKRAGKQKPKAEQVASRHAEQRLNARIDQQAAENLDRANGNYQSKFRQPLEERNLFPELQFRTCKEKLYLTALAADDYQTAALTAPPEPLPDSDLAMRMHQSLFNNIASSALAGRTVHEATVQQAVVDLYGKLPDELKSDEEGQPWSITFAEEEPITLAIGENSLKITLRGKAYGRGENTYPGMNVSATYKIVRDGEGFKGVRQGKVEILPPDFKPGSGQRLSGRQTTIASLLERRFGKVFREEIVGQGLVLPGQWKQAGTFKPNYLAAGGGWLLIAWRQAAPAAAD